MKYAKIVALIPARGGSKGIQKKNLQKIAGKTLVEITILQSRACAEIEKIYLSTDDEEIAEIGKVNNSEIIVRPAEYSTDDALASDVVKHFIDSQKLSLSREDRKTLIIYLQPTSPFRSTKLIKESIEKYREHNTPTVSVMKPNINILKLLKIDDHGRIQPLDPNASPTSNRQTLSDNFVATGEVYVFSVENFLENEDIPVVNAFPVISKSRYQIDIDSPMDLEIAQLIGERNGI